MIDFFGEWRFYSSLLFALMFPYECSTELLLPIFIVFSYIDWEQYHNCKSPQHKFIKLFILLKSDKSIGKNVIKSIYRLTQ